MTALNCVIYYSALLTMNPKKKFRFQNKKKREDIP